MKKILIIPARKHSLEAYSEYLIRYLSDEFYFEMGYPPEPPYHNIRERVWSGSTSPLEKNPDEFDLIYPHFTTHFFLDPAEKYFHKIALVFLEPGSYQTDKAVIAATSEPVAKDFEGNPYHNLRFGVDTNLFAPYPMVRTDDLFHVGFIGNINTPRRYIKELFMPLQSLPGVRLMIYPTVWHKHTRVDEIEGMGGQDLIDSIVGGDMWWSGFPNCYNQMDIFVRCDINPGYQFSVLEAAACGVPVVTTDPGLGKELCDAGGGIYVECETGFEPKVLEELAGRIRKAVIQLKDNKSQREEMGKLGRKFVEENYTWDKWIPAWREFFREGLTNASKTV